MKSKKILCMAVAFAMTLGMAVSVPDAMAVSLSEPCSLTISIGNRGFSKDLKGPQLANPAAGSEAEGEDGTGQDVEDLTGVVYDLYLVSEAAAMPGYDAYTYREVDPALSGSVTLPDLEHADNDMWRLLADEAAIAVLNPVEDEDGLVSVSPIEPSKSMTGEALSNLTLDTPVQNIRPGLYLAIAHGKNIEPVDYFSWVRNDDGSKRPVTVAYSTEFQYIFQPELISLPGKDAYVNTETGEQISGPNTANPLPWKYDMALDLKPEREYRFSKLTIEKTVDFYDKDEPATFVFEITAVKDDEVVYENVVSVTLSQESVQTAVVDRIPVGAEVTVREIYSGTSYVIDGDQEQKTVITVDGDAKVEFANTYDRSQNHGHGILNQFTFTDDMYGGKWDCVQNPDFSEVAEQ